MRRRESQKQRQKYKTTCDILAQNNIVRFDGGVNNKP